MAKAINQRIAKNILHVLAGGTVPDNGLQYIAVGRRDEVEAFTRDMDKIEEGYSTFRLLEGPYGSGKSFMSKLIKNEALLRGFVVLECELAPERKLCGTKREGLETYKCLMAKASTRTCPTGGALEELLDGYLYSLEEQARQPGLPERAQQNGRTEEEEVCEEVLLSCASLRKLIENLPHGFDFYHVFCRYARSWVTHDEDGVAAAMRWFRGEYQTKTEAKRALQASDIVTDENWFSYIKIWAVLVREIGYQGLYVILDELTQITRNITNAITREHNFERLLSMYNDCYGSDARYMGIVLCGIPSSIHDTKRGIFSYEALRSRLDVSKLQGSELYNSPIIKLSMLTKEEFVALIGKLDAMYAMVHQGEQETYFSEEEQIAFVTYEYRRIAAANHLTPREFIRDFLTILDLKATSRPQDGMREFLGGGIHMTESMIGAGERESAAGAGKYENFSL